MYKFYQQNSPYGKTIKYPSKNHPSATIATSGCGICAVAMAIWNYGRHDLPSVATLAKMAINYGARVAEGTDMSALLNMFQRKGFIKDWKSTSSSAEFQKHLDNGFPAIVHAGGANLFSTSGHFVTAMGIENGKIAVADPQYYNGKYTANSKRKSQLSFDKSRQIVLVSPSNLHTDTKGKRYYLISPKASAPSLKVGKTYTLTAPRGVYDNVSGDRLRVSDLTSSGRQSATTRSGWATLEVGTKVTVQKIVKNKYGNLWVKIPSGWLCVHSDGATYIL